jgi:hypothetical protein
VSLAKLERAVARTHRAYEETDTVDSTGTPGTDAEPAGEYADGEVELDSEVDTDA